MAGSLDGGVAIVTGGGGGLGAAGAAVAAVDAAREEAERVARLVSSDGATCLAVECDVSDRLPWRR